MILSIPDVRQSGDYDCGAAAVESVLRFHGVRPSPWVRKLANPVQGMAPDTIEAVLWESLGCVAGGVMMVDDLRHFAGSSRPVLCPVTIDGFGHWVVVRGVCRGRVYFQCPLSGPQVIGSRHWSMAWHDSTPGSVYRSYGIVGWRRGD